METLKQVTMMTTFYWVALIILYLLDLPAPFTKHWIQNNTEQSLQWILEAKNANL
jgi:hypothetical protein